MSNEPQKTTVSRNPFRVGNIVGGCEITDFLGEGGMGTVYLGKQLSLARPVAIKVLAARHLEKFDLLERFKREARTLAGISHGNIVAIYDLKLEEETPYLVMEYIDGVSLDRLIKERGIFEIKDAVGIALQICAGLAYAHGKNIIHRDLKPANILITADGRVKIVDFGLAGILRNPEEFRVTSVSVVMGTPDYMAPEQKQSTRDADERADLYSLGVILYQLLTGKLPAGRFADPHELNPGIPAKVSQIIVDLLAFDPQKRPADASSVARLIAPWADVDHRPAEVSAQEVSELKKTPLPEEDRMARFSFLSSFFTLLTAYAFSFQLLEIRGMRLLEFVMRLTGIGAIVLGWRGLQRIRSSGGAKSGARLALFGILSGIWILWIFWLSSRRMLSPAQLLLTRLPVTAGMLAVFALVDWLLRPRDDMGTLFTQAGGMSEKFAWLAVILLPSFLLVPLVGVIEPDIEVKASFFRWISVALGPLIYLILIVAPYPNSRR